jgi:hypothetical protein
MATTMGERHEQIQIPVIDILRACPDDDLSVAEELVQAAAVHGFVYIKNLGKDISIPEINHAFDLVSTQISIIRDRTLAYKRGKYSLKSSLLLQLKKKKSVQSKKTYVCRLDVFRDSRLSL